MIDTASLKEWTPIHCAGENGVPIELMERDKFIMRLQDGLLVARAKRLVRRIRHANMKVVVTHETDVTLEPHYWSTDLLGFFDHSFWIDGDHRIANPSTVDAFYDGDHVTFYGIEVREALDLSGVRAEYEEVLAWCADWLASQRSTGKGTGENIAWPDFKREPRHEGLSREDVFRPAFRAAKSGRL